MGKFREIVRSRRAQLLAGVFVLAILMVLIWITWPNIDAVPGHLDDADHYAQLSMARAAWATFWLAVVGGGVSLLTLYFVWVTVRYTRQAADSAREANNQAREAFIGENRAWMQIERVTPVSDLVWSDTEGRTNFEIVVRNIGRTPCISCWIEVKFLIDFNIFEADENAISAYLSPTQGRRLGWSAFPNETIAVNHGIPISVSEAKEAWRKIVGAETEGPVMVFPRLLVAAVYQLAIDSDPHVTAKIFELSAVAKDNSMAIGPDFGTLPLDRMVLRPAFHGRTLAT